MSSCRELAGCEGLCIVYVLLKGTLTVLLLSMYDERFCHPLTCRVWEPVGLIIYRYQKISCRLRWF